MGSKRDKEDVPMTCADCGKQYTMKFGSWRRNKNGIHRCKDCTMKELQRKINGSSEEERNALIARRNAAIKAGWAKQTDEQKKKISLDRSIAWSNDMKRKADLHERLVQMWKNMSDEDKNKQWEIMGKARNAYWNDDAHRKYHSCRARKKWYAQAPEEQARIIAAANKGYATYLENETAEQRAERLKKMSISMKKWWSSLSNEEFDEHIKKYRFGMDKYFKKLNQHNPNQNESVFIGFLEKYLLSFHHEYYSQKKYPNFDELFPENPVRKGIRIHPYHVWDFIIHLKDKDILVDVDGSIHDPESSSNVVRDSHGNQFVLYDYISFNDSQRLYQTDGMDAYVVECYDNNMTEDSIVRNITSGKTTSLKNFLVDLSWESLSDEDKKEFLAEAMK